MSTNKQIAIDALNDDDPDMTDASRARVIQRAQVYAMLAIVDELKEMNRTLDKIRFRIGS